jgi:hypothetical protein
MVARLRRVVGFVVVSSLAIGLTGPVALASASAAPPSVLRLAGVLAPATRPAASRLFAADDNVAGAVALPASPAYGSLDASSDPRDVYSVALSAGQRITLSLTAGTGTDMRLSLFGPGTTDVTTDSPVAGMGGPGYPQATAYTVPAGKAGTYYVDAAAVAGSGNYALTYSVADPAPKIDWVKSSNPIAYNLASMRSTHFTASVNTPNVRAELVVITPNGNVTIFKGVIAHANSTVWFPQWNGKMPNGKLLPTASYDWRLTVTKGDQSSVARGKIIVSRICFSMKGTVSGYIDVNDFGNSIERDAYMLKGSANCYLSVTTTYPEDQVRMLILGPLDYGVMVAWDPFTNAGAMSGTAHLRDKYAPRANGLHRIVWMGTNGVTYSATMVQ